MSSNCLKYVVVFQEKHGNAFGLKITSWDAVSFKVISGVCLYCTVFGQEDARFGAKCKWLQNPKYWKTGSFYNANYLSHMYSQHEAKLCQMLKSVDEQLCCLCSIRYVTYAENQEMYLLAPQRN